MACTIRRLIDCLQPTERPEAPCLPALRAGRSAAEATALGAPRPEKLMLWVVGRDRIARTSGHRGAARMRLPAAGAV